MIFIQNRKACTNIFIAMNHDCPMNTNMNKYDSWVFVFIASVQIPTLKCMHVLLLFKFLYYLKRKLFSDFKVGSI